MSGKRQEALFTTWINDHKGAILKVVRAYADTSTDQDDLFQEILFQVWHSIPRFKEACKVSTWIYRVAFNTAMTWMRKEKRYRLSHQAMPEIEQIPYLGGDDDSAAREQALLNRLYAAIRKLRKPDRSLVLLHLDGLAYRDIAQVLGITEGNVGVKLTRIRKRLTDLLKGTADEF